MEHATAAARRSDLKRGRGGESKGHTEAGIRRPHRPRRREALRSPGPPPRACYVAGPRTPVRSPQRDGAAGPSPAPAAPDVRLRPRPPANQPAIFHLSLPPFSLSPFSRSCSLALSRSLARAFYLASLSPCLSPARPPCLAFARSLSLARSHTPCSPGPAAQLTSAQPSPVSEFAAAAAAAAAAVSPDPVEPSSLTPRPRA